MTVDECCNRYIELFENLTPDRLGDLAALLSQDVRFRDPFNDVHGVPAMLRVLEDMFERTENPAFSVTHYCIDGERAYLNWRFSARVPVLGDWSVEGVSLLHFDRGGKVCAHLDYWDAGLLYARIPLLGWLIGRLRRRLAAKG
ncbi:hypothetical protein GCM10011348_14860 [Marinobacterium nitratireducens]|uniref:SnoaL-like domain-containing protein n=1 Tax=Marinobacterium nitratireducens TaxID=518897 RepID=A0A918DS00_9GAMM|nr:nuclear transport factor 2 family protein [Marinobacterium nitratireducens]GGO79754.1 hypothetical protein GCM10011348_14860 [Marinobacterium nitratireducens]